MRNTLMAAFVALASTIALAAPVHQDQSATPRAADPHNSTFLSGRLGTLPSLSPQSARVFVEQSAPSLGLEGSERFQVRSAEVDELGQMHVRLQQYVNGLKVWGGEMIVHADTSTRNVFALNGRAAANRNLPMRPSIAGREALRTAAIEAGIDQWQALSEPELSYVINEKGATFLAWNVRASYINEEGEQIDRIFADATNGDLVAQHPEIHRAKSRSTYSANYGTSLPGTLKRSEGQGAVSDIDVNAAHDSAGIVYDYYSSKHGRDSYNGSGATIRSTVHYDSNYNNAFWNGSQMVYGDGDGSQFAPLARGFDVVAHELTHAVTDYSADLVYQNESGALNEAMSDVFAAAAEAYRDGSVNSDTWKIGEDIMTPGTSGDALRYMNNPTADGSSNDYYPERYTGTGDYGGVHLNSGIANLAFYLLVQGGSHPRGKTSVSVPAIGMAQSEKIFYRALTSYMTSSTNFQGARNATAQAAQDLYGSTAVNAVHKAWDAVGVPGGQVSVITLSNGQTRSGLSGSSGSWQYFKIAVPSGQDKLEIIMSGGSGDGDLYVKRGSSPTSSSYDYRPYLNGNNETVNVTSPASGDWYIGIHAYSSFSSVSLKATYSTTGGGGGGGGGSCTSASGSLSGRGDYDYHPNGSYYYSSVSGTHTATLSGPSSADFDLYLQKWSGSGWSIVKRSESATSTESISYSGTSGYYRWRVYSYSGSGSYTICTTKP